MTEVQVTSWREVPSIVTARDGDESVKISMPQRFQEAIDEAAMRAGASDADAYMQGWHRSDWTLMEGSVSQAAESVAAELEAAWGPEAMAAYLDSFDPA